VRVLILTDVVEKRLWHFSSPHIPGVHFATRGSSLQVLRPSAHTSEGTANERKDRSHPGNPSDRTRRSP